MVKIVRLRYNGSATCRLIQARNPRQQSLVDDRWITMFEKVLCRLLCDATKNEDCFGFCKRNVHPSRVCLSVEHGDYWTGLMFVD
jgi:hypothetical protein